MTKPSRADSDRLLRCICMPIISSGCLTGGLGPTKLRRGRNRKPSLEFSPLRP
jgi:hypothetical protein